MYKVKLETGETINFETEPTQDDIEEAVSSLQPKQQTSFLQDAFGDISQVGSEIKNTFSNFGERVSNTRDLVSQDLQDKGLNSTFSDISGTIQGVGSTLLKTGSDVLGSVVKGGVKLLVSDNTEQEIKQDVQNFLNPIVTSKPFQTVSTALENDPLAKDYLETGLAATDFIGIGAAKKGVQLGAEVGSNLVSKGKTFTESTAGGLVKKFSKTEDEAPTSSVFDDVSDPKIVGEGEAEKALFRYDSQEVIDNLTGIEKQQAIFAKTLKEELVDQYSVLNKEVTRAAKQGNDPVGISVRNGIIPDLIESAGKIYQKYSPETVKRLEEIKNDRFSVLSDTLNKLDTNGIQAPSIDEIGFEALEIARKSADENNVVRVLKEVESKIDEIRSGYFEKKTSVNWKTLNQRKSNLYKDINWTDTDASIKSEAYDAISSAIRKATEKIAPETRALNKEVGSLLSARNFVEKFNNANRIIPYGSRFANILFGGVLGRGVEILSKASPLGIPLEGLAIAKEFLSNKALTQWAKTRYLKGVNLESLKQNRYIPEIYQKLGIVDPSIRKEIVNLGKKYFGDEGIEILPKLMDGQLGKYENGVISIVARKDAVDTLNHEVIHKAIDVFLGVEEKLKLLDDATKRFGNLPARELEEKIAESFVNYVKTKDKTTLFGKVIQRIKSFITNKDSITGLYERLRSGEFSKKTGTSTGSLEDVFKSSKLSKQEVIQVRQIIEGKDIDINLIPDLNVKQIADITTDGSLLDDFAPSMPSPKEYYDFQNRVAGFGDVKEVAIAKNVIARSLIESSSLRKEILNIVKDNKGFYTVLKDDLVEINKSINSGKEAYKRVGDEIFSRDKRIGSVEEKLDRLNSNDYNTKYDKNLDDNITGNRTSNKQGGSSISTSLPDGLNLGRLSENGKGQSIGTTKDLPKQRLSKDQQRILQKEGSLKLKNEEVEAIFGEEIYRIINDSLEKIVEIEPSIREIGNVVLYNTKDDIVKATGGLNVKASLTTGNGRWNINIKADEEIKDYIVRHEARHLEQLFVKDFNKEVVEGLSITDDVKPYIQQHMEVLDVYTGKKSKPVKTIEEALKETDRILKLSKIPKEKYNNEYKNILAIEQDALNAEAPKSKFLDKNRIFGKIDSREANLLEEAKKYKSAEEFVKAQGKEIYHGTDKVFKELDVTKTPDGSVWFTDNLDSIKKGESGASGTKRIINKFINENDLKLAGWDDYDNYSLDQLQEMGFDGVKLPENGKVDYQIFNIGKLKTKSQLEQIWKEANTT